MDKVINDKLVDKIASFFEREANWRALKNCYLENDRSNDLRNLLHKALKDSRIYILKGETNVY